MQDTKLRKVLAKLGIISDTSDESMTFGTDIHHDEFVAMQFKRIRAEQEIYCKNVIDYLIEITDAIIDLEFRVIGVLFP